MITRILHESDVQQYQDLRLSALLTNPEAFGSTYERESRFRLDLVIDRIRPSKDKFVLGALDEHGSLGGIVAFVRESGMKTTHKANVFGMYVSKEKRGQGIGKLLLLELIKMARDIDGLEQINLSVVSNNESAKKLYQAVGFETYGLERNALKFNGQYYDENLMVLRL
ncbi:acetyltransferase [Bacillus sp. FJAT-18019]|uniref:Acetyltransferase n=1 Tax=Paenibacillus solani TaxID=1705565 RepID=A0A0M1P8M5_9BACL|nr:GNAT family protein [Paenibacillus solani]KOP67201.1 acetyltransferase [Bacillus sp. FJAT-18019]KOR90354.1 acetyltransferase [Paenibacillus solani]